VGLPLTARGTAFVQVHMNIAGLAAPCMARSPRMLVVAIRLPCGSLLYALFKP